MSSAKSTISTDRQGEWEAPPITVAHREGIPPARTSLAEEQSDARHGAEYTELSEYALHINRP